MTTATERLVPVLAAIADDLEAASREVRAIARPQNAGNVPALQSVRQTVRQTLDAIDETLQRMSASA